MPSILLPGVLRTYVDGFSEVHVSGSTVRLALEDLLSRYPNFRQHLCKPDGSLHRYMNLYLDETNLKELQGLDTPLKPADVLRLVPSIAGG
jgi:adenylyltransferase/sulfurtransferase